MKIELKNRSSQDEALLDFTGSTKSILNSFVSSYPNVDVNLKNSLPYVYVGEGEVKLIAKEVNFKEENSTVFALAVAQDGFIEILKLDEGTEPL